MSEDIQGFRDRQLSQLTKEIGVYVLCDLDGVPIYTGQSVDGIRTRVRRHLTSARSDAIANRQLDVWEVSFVRAYPIARDKISELESYLIHKFHREKPLMQGNFPEPVASLSFEVPTPELVQVLPDDIIEQRKNPAVRLPRQAQFFYQLVDHILNVKNKPFLRETLRAHFDRLSIYYETFLDED
tara:strand:- start:15201 stop:15752 length:552 start_codon:yes stop_codon:yes gene_type:complete